MQGSVLLRGQKQARAQQGHATRTLLARAVDYKRRTSLWSNSKMQSRCKSALEPRPSNSRLII